MATDPSDWSFKPLKDLDSLLRCPICFDYFSTAVMLPRCSHNYCSLCVRRFLVHKQLCPSCNEPATEADLKCNRLLDELVTSFKNSRSDFMALAQLSMLKNKSKEASLPVQAEESVSRTDKKESASHSKRVGHNSRQREGKVTKTERTAEKSLVEMPMAQKETKVAIDKIKMDVNGREPSLELEFSEDAFCVPKPPSLCNGKFDFSEICSRDVSTTPPLEDVGQRPGFSTTFPPLHPTATPTSGVKPRKRVLQFEDEAVLKPPSNSRVGVAVEEEGIVEMEDLSACDGDLTPLLPEKKREGPAGVTQGSLRNEDSRDLNSESKDDVECPVCGEKVKVLLINAHLDRCLCEPFLSVSPPPTPPFQRVLPPSTQALPPKLSGVPIIYKQGKALPRLPKFVFSIMKDRELKKKLKEYHLPTHGQRKALIARLEEFTLQYKAQQDSLCPKAVKEIAQSVERAERERDAARKPAASLNTTIAAISANRRNASSSEIDKERKSYAHQHASHFAELIANTRERQGETSGNKAPEGPDKGQGLTKGEGDSSECNEKAGVLAGESPEEVADQEWWDRWEEEEEEESLVEEVEEGSVLDRRRNTTNTIPESPAISRSRSATPSKGGPGKQVTPSRSPFKFRYLGSPSFPATPSPISSKRSRPSPSPSFLQRQRGDTDLVGGGHKKAKLRGQEESDSEWKPAEQTVVHQDTPPRIRTRRSLRIPKT